MQRLLGDFVGKLSRLQKLCLAALSLLFVILCWNITKVLNLWGDEAFSLDLASGGWGAIWLNPDNHTPAHFVLLKALVSLVGGSYDREPLLRMLHVPFFLAGFYFGFRTVKRASGSAALAALALLLAMLLPLFPYYATNLRMYGLVFLGSMWFIDAVAAFLSGDKALTDHAWSVLPAGFLLLFSDYVGAILYLIGAGFVAVRNFQRRDNRATLLLLLPPALLGALLAPVIVHNLVMVAQWPTKSTQDVSAGFHLGNILYNKFRPLVDLADISFRDLRLPLLQLAIYAGLLCAGTVAAAGRLRRKGPSALPFLLAVSYAWLCTAAATQTSPTRAYLFSQFFMAALILAGLKALSRVRFWAAAALGALMFALASWTAFHPVPRFNSLLPCHAIAGDVLEQSRALKAPTVLISDNSLDTLVVRRYLLQGGLDPADCRMLGETFTAQDLPAGPCLYLSYLGGQPPVDVQRVSQGRAGWSVVNQYVDLGAMPYNTLWKKHFQDKTSQAYAYVLYEVK